MMRNAVLVAAASLLLSSAGICQEQPQPGGTPKADRGMRQRNLQVWTEAAGKLNLTDAQRKEMRKLRLDMQRKNIPIESQIRLARLEIREEMTSEKPERAKIEKQMKQVADLELQLKLNRLDHQFAVRALLTPEQLKNWRGPEGMGPGVHKRIQFMRQRGPNQPTGFNLRTLREGQTEEDPLAFDEPMGFDELIGIDEPMDVEENIIIERE
jgi:Spy/CpxP family protein refolding chaperone